MRKPIRYRIAFANEILRVRASSLFLKAKKLSSLPRVASTPMNASACEIVEVGKRRDGGSRFWCLRHGANATAKYGVSAHECVAAHDVPVTEAETFRLVPSEFSGGVALWGAVPPVYDTTDFPVDRGIHVHARRQAGKKKEIDTTYRRVVIPFRKDLLASEWMTIEEIDAINFMVSQIFGFETSIVVCPRCGTSHLDRDWFAVHPHKRHLCHGCGRHFTDSLIGVGNPISIVQRAFAGGVARTTKRATESLAISQADYPGGVQIWGSNPAILWTSPLEEKEGIHLHAYDADGNAVHDGTYASVELDGVRLGAAEVRTYMAQLAMPHIADRVTAAECTACGSLQFDAGTYAYTPSASCHKCGGRRASRKRYKKVIANPLVDQIDRLEKYAPRPARRDRLNLRPEAI